MRAAQRLHPADFAHPATARSLQLSDLRLSPEQLDSFLDLGPYVNPAPYVVQADTSLVKASSASLLMQ